MNTRVSEHILNILEWPGVMTKLLANCKTPVGREHASGIAPLPVNQVKNQMKKISDLKDIMILGESPDFSGINDIRPLLVRAEKESVLKLEELAWIRKFLLASERLISFLGKHKEEFKNIGEEYSNLDRLEQISSLIIPSITDEDELNKTKYPLLRKLEDSIFSSKKQAEKSILKIAHSSSMEIFLQEKIFTTMNNRYVILVKSNMKGRIKGAIHGISSSGATLYFEPESIRELNDKIIMLELDLQREINRILENLSWETGNHAGLISSNLVSISYLDFLNAAALFSRDINASEPEITDKPVIRLLDAKHPLLYLMNKSGVISNNVELGIDFNCLIISGANTGGKTVLLKTVGLCVLFAMFGLHIPAREDSQIGVFSSIYADIGDDQSLEQSLSTYSGQIVAIDRMIRQADSRSLVLIDEIIVGTNPRQGAALAQAILESMAETDSKIIVTTHYSELKELASKDKKFMNASVSFDMDTLKPTYRLNTGLPGVSYAMEIARNYGLDEKILSRSGELLDSRDLSVEALLEQVQKFKQKTEDERIRIQELKDELSEEKKKYNSKKTEYTSLIKELKEAQQNDLLQELNEYRNSVSERIKNLQQTDIKDAGKIQEDIIALQGKVSSMIKNDSLNDVPEDYIPAAPDKISVGDTVFISSLEKNGKIEEIDSSGRTATILFGGSIRSRFKTDELLISTKKATPGIRKKQKNEIKFKEKASSPDNSKSIPVTIQTSYNTIDLRGKRVEEAISIMQTELDRMSRQNIGTSVIIHGHGTGALKEAVRQNLKYSTYVSDFRHGEMGEGGDGVTIAILRN